MVQPAADAVAVPYEHSAGLAALLGQLGVSLLITTYQAGRVLRLGTYQGRLDVTFHAFEQPMGLARTPTGLAVGTRRQIWMLLAAPDLAARVPPSGRFDGCFLTRSSFFTGPILGHEMVWGEDELWVVNTLFSCLCVAGPMYSFVPRWRPPFVSGLAAEDRCHLNGLALESGKPRYATALGETDTPAGWRPGKATGGVVLDVPANEVVLRGLSMPHSPRIFGKQLLLLDSGRGQLVLAEPDANRVTTIAPVPGYARGLDTFGRYAFVGLSRIRETAVFGGLPIAERRGELRCGLAIVDLSSGQPAGHLFFGAGVEEVFEVKVLPGFRCPYLSGPDAEKDGTEPLWLVPGEGPKPPSRA